MEIYDEKGISMYFKRFFLFLFFVIGSLSSIDLVRLGTTYGGWTIPKNFLAQDSICYCVGAGEDLSFDILLAEKYGSKIFIIDPTPRAIQHFNYIKESLRNGTPAHINGKSESYYLTDQILSCLTYIPAGLWSSDSVQKFYVPKNPLFVSHSIVNMQNTKDYIEVPCRRLSSLMQELGHKKIDLLKLDIEGAAYAVLDSIFEDDIDVTCLCVEFDEFAGKYERDQNKVDSYIEKLFERGYELVYQKGYVDMTFVKKELLEAL